MSDLLAALPRLLPEAVRWVEAQEREILRDGVPLTERHREFAVAVGVGQPALVRVKIVMELPLPSGAELRNAAIQTGLIGSNTHGMTFGHGVLLRTEYATERLLSHELRHVHQYEAAGSIDAFLSTYLRQIVTVGYERAALEVDARAYERDS
jgi:hypothetical protein